MQLSYTALGWHGWHAWHGQPPLLQCWQALQAGFHTQLACAMLPPPLLAALWTRSVGTHRNAFACVGQRIPLNAASALGLFVAQSCAIAVAGHTSVRALQGGEGQCVKVLWQQLVSQVLSDMLQGVPSLSAVV